MPTKIHIRCYTLLCFTSQSISGWHFTQQWIISQFFRQTTTTTTTTTTLFVQILQCENTCHVFTQKSSKATVNHRVSVWEGFLLGFLLGFI
jgi:hypothetical protein